MEAQTTGQGPLTGLRVLDIATVIAGPFAASMMADFGADVTKIELPGGADGLRAFPPFKDGKSLWWKVTNRGKRFATLDVRKPDGRDLFLKMIAQTDVLIENFRPGTLDKWGLDIDTLWSVNPRLVVLRCSAFGQDGPYAKQPGFARIFEAMGGLTQITGEPDGKPMHTGYPLGDPIGGLFGAFAILAALFDIRTNARERGEEIDLALTEATFRILEFLAIGYDQAGVVTQRHGNRNQYAAPGDVYMTLDKRHVSLAGSTNAIFANNAKAIGRPELIEDPRYATTPQRNSHSMELDKMFGAWFAAHTQAEAVEAFRAAGGSLAPIYSIDQIFADPQMIARGAIPEVPDEDFGTVRMQGLVPRFRHAPGQIRWAAKAVGADNEYVYKSVMGLVDAEVQALKDKGIL
ncbi:MAG: CoA transferase [Rhodobacter sp.]|nr:CoA transferase [Paracoccaceae bacterium]MCC0076571.1 CoA transferase [Rhodobacter sp.]